MNLGVTDQLRPLLDAVKAFIKERVVPVDAEYLAEIDKGDRWALTARQSEIIRQLKSQLKGLSAAITAPAGQEPPPPHY